jgi:hypothetical protein
MAYDLKPYVYKGNHDGPDSFDAVALMPRRGELKPCGTRPAYQRHVYRNEEPCGPCKQAAREYANASARKKYREKRWANQPS